MSDSQVIIFDTTLRDGEQAPGFPMNTVEKLEMARQLAAPAGGRDRGRLPISSDEDFEATREVAKQVGTLEGRPQSAASPGSGSPTSTAAGKPYAYARRPRIHTSWRPPTPPQVQAAQVARRGADGGRAGRATRARYCADVEFSPEDASRSDFDYMCDVLSAVIDAGAQTVNIPTLGYAVPRSGASGSPGSGAGPGHRPRGPVGPLPQRPRAGRGQLA